MSRVRRAGGAAGAVAAVALLLLVVALASRPEGGAALPSLGEDPARVAVDAIFYLLLALAALWLGVIVWVLWPRPGEELPPLKRRRWPLGMLFTIAASVVVAVWLRSGYLRGLSGLDPAGPVGAAAAPRSPLLGAPTPPHAAVDWLALGIVAGLLAVAGWLTWRWLRPRSPRSRRTVLAHVESVMDDAIEDVLAEADPRRAVIAAWARLERVLARHGLPRRVAEAPLEYATRAAGQLAVQEVSLERLADLFEWARFSLNDVTPAMRGEALDGLLTVRDGLRVAI
jgi:hypothetical protein